MLSFFLITRHGQRCRDSSQAQSPQASQWPSTKEHPYAPRFTFQQQVLHNLGDPSMPSAGKKALGRFALSSENLGGVSSQHEQPVASSALKALLQHRQRLLSLMSYPAKLKREGVAGVLGVHLGAHKPLGQPGPPTATIFRAGQTRLPRRVVHLALAQGPHHQAGQRQRWQRAWQAAALCAGQQLGQSLHRHALLLGNGG
ncbi:hypothetical protein PCANC_27801 [Puccinia coronata f. sp. avenae]|uniref:Uncharacterized protein n=1 Tax=Puccinia coronata f. sp. avenae TaxID=200324 RepID=A0A2N5TZ77_9BASI|nr:hypothetical protein PCANC_27801 [Puccinia coronata f. sp. avenae]